MASFNGKFLTPNAITAGMQGPLLGRSFGNRFVLAMHDNTGARYVWTDTSVTTANAPTPTGTYVTSTLTVLSGP